MKVECGKQRLKEAVLLAERVTGKYLSLPILRMILLVATENTLKIRATNLDIGVEFSLPAKVSQEGVVAIPGDLLGGYLNGIPQEKNIQLELVNGNLTLTSEKSMTIIKGHPYEDFPTIPSIKEGTPFLIESKKFIEGLRGVSFAALHSDVKPEFHSVYCYSEEKDLVFVATDMSRLAEKKIPLKSNAGVSPILIPLKNTAEIIKILDGIDEEITVVASPTQMTISTGNLYLTSRLVDGVFPDYRQIFPKRKTLEATILTQDLREALRVSGMFSGKQEQVLFKAYPEDHVFEIEAKREDVGESLVRIDAVLKGELVEMGFNHRFIQEVFQHVSTGSVLLSFDRESKTLLLKTIPETKFAYLVKYMKS